MLLPLSSCRESIVSNVVFEASALMGVRGFWLSAGAKWNFEIINAVSEMEF